MRRRLVGLFAALYAAVGVSQPTSFAVKCWRVETNATTGVSTLAATGLDAGCPVGVDVVDLTAAFAPGDDVPAIWTVALKTASDNAIAMPVLPLATGSRPQIAATFVRSCDSIVSCDPTSSAVAATEPQSSNFTSSGDALTFSSISGLRFSTEGEFPIAAFVVVADIRDAAVSYVFAAYATVVIQSKVSPSTTNTPGAVRCRMSRQNPLNATLDPLASVSESSNCELRMALASLDVVTPNASTRVGWTATLDQRLNADIHLPVPLTTTTIGGVAYEIVTTFVKVCKSDATCDEYTAAEDLEQVVVAGPASFGTDGTAAFTSPNVTVASVRRQPAMIHMVLAGPSRRYDFVYYFELVATPAGDLTELIDATSYVADAQTSYCWDVLADATLATVAASSVVTLSQGASCPYTTQLTLPTATVTSDDALNLTWTISASSNSSFDRVHLTTVYDADVGDYVSLPALNVFACGNGTACTPFARDATLLLRLPARNLSDGAKVIRADGIKFPGEGNYTILVHSVFANGASRVDTAVYGVVAVTKAVAANAIGADVASTSKSRTVVYVLVAVGALVAVGVVVFAAVWLRRRQQRQRMDKLVQYGMFGAPQRHPTQLKTADSRGSFLSGGDAHPSFAFAAAQPSPFETPRDGSLSFNDAYRRSSFDNDMSLEESNLSFAFTDGDRSALSFAFTDDRSRDSRESYDV